jgi:hypothetical protein
MNKSILVFAFALCIASCSLFQSTDYTTEEGSKAIKSIMTEKVGGDIVISDIAIVTSLELNTSAEIINVYEKSDASKANFHSISLSGAGRVVNELQDKISKGNGGVKISDIPDALYSDNCEKILPLIPEELKFASIKQYEQDFSNSKPGKVSITAHATDKNGSSKLKGKKVETTFYELKFEISESGTAKLLD